MRHKSGTIAFHLLIGWDGGKGNLSDMSGPNSSKCDPADDLLGLLYNSDGSIARIIDVTFDVSLGISGN
jgi:hypothetical protein